MKGSISMTTDDYYNQHNTALNERIVRIINRSKKFVICSVNVDNIRVVVEVQAQPGTNNSEITEWVQTTVKYVYSTYKNDEGRINNLYAAIAYKFIDMDIKITELDSGGSGTTVHFNSTHPSQVIKI